jgi:hypothetical protein
MRLTIIRDTNSVIVDGEGYTIDCSMLPRDLHAVQWYGMAGEVEYAMMRCDHCGVASKKPNEVIKDLAPYQFYVDAHASAKAAHAAAVAAAQEALKNAAGPES